MRYLVCGAKTGVFSDETIRRETWPHGIRSRKCVSHEDEDAERVKRLMKCEARDGGG